MLSAEGMKLPPAYTPGFAPPEMHAQRELLGPWSDIYSVGATMYACFAGGGAAAAPNARLEKDELVPASQALRRQVRGRAARDRRLVPAARPPAAGRRACSRCRKPCWVKSPTIVQASRVGAREINEDRVGHWSAPEAVLIAVADGLGGHMHGELAAQIAVDILGAAFAAEAQRQARRSGFSSSRARSPRRTPRSCARRRSAAIPTRRAP